MREGFDTNSGVKSTKKETFSQQPISRHSCCTNEGYACMHQFPLTSTLNSLGGALFIGVKTNMLAGP